MDGCGVLMGSTEHRAKLRVALRNEYQLRVATLFIESFLLALRDSNG